jgi:hypothetical protein
VLRNQSERFQRGEQSQSSILGDPGPLRQFNHRVSAARNPGEKVDVEAANRACDAMKPR